MGELIDAVTSRWSLLLVLLVFGSAPGICLRLIVLMYPPNDPRRRELISELRAVPRFERPLWVAEQFEVVLFEGLAHRLLATLRRVSRRRAQAPTDEHDARDKYIGNLFDQFIYQVDLALADHQRDAERRIQQLREQLMPTSKPGPGQPDCPDADQP